MKQLRILTRVYDRMEGNEYIQRSLCFDLTEDQAERFAKLYEEICKSNDRVFPHAYGFGEKDTPSNDFRTPLAERFHNPLRKKDENRFLMLTDFGIIDEDEKQINGFTDF